MANTEDIEALAAEIGENVYMDIAKWHLLLSDAHLHTTVAEQLYSILQSGSLSKDQVSQVLSKIPVKLGGGQTELPLSDLIPTQGQATLMDILEEFQQKL